MKKNRNYLFLLLVSCTLALSLNSCVSSKKLAYFNQMQKDTVIMMHAFQKVSRIHKNDILQITMVSTDAAEMNLLNGTNGNSSAPVTAGGTIIGNLVGDDGNISLPLIGSLKAEGLTKDELAALVKKTLIEKQLALNPAVTVRILNYKITVLGEVNRPGEIPVPNEKITFPEALGLAGDLTPYGRRNNVLLMRVIDDKVVLKRFDLNKEAIFDKDLYYLQNNDIIYVEPNNAKAYSSDQITQILPVVLSALSVFAVILALFIRK